MSSKMAKDKRVQFYTSNYNLFEILKKHVKDWAQDHPTEKFITQKDFQIQFSQFDKFDSALF